MAAARLFGAVPSKRYRLFIYLAVITIFMQLFLAYNFYTMNQKELDRINELESRKQRSTGESLLKQEDQILNHGIVDDEVLHKIDRLRKPNKLKRLLPAANNTDKKSLSFHQIQNKLDNPMDKNQMNKNQNAAEDVDFNPTCHIQAAEAISAIGRAKSKSCKQEIADLVCRHESQNIFAQKLPRYCSLKGNNRGSYAGCYSDNRSQRLLSGVKEEFRSNNTPDRCIQFCYTAGTKYAGVQYGYECWCGDSLKGNRLEETKCDHPCAGQSKFPCGGYLAVNVYHTGVGEKPNNPAPLVRELEPNDDPVKIVFVLTVSGRAVRQVKRLLKMLYSPQHYYYIHVDARQEYMYRELLPLNDMFSNVHVTSNRLSTIWGGASLLSVHLNCMKELLSLKQWNWDYFINLSESDFPIKPLNELVAYLTRNQGMNFLRAHGTNTPKFIRKQGLDKLFVECDTHMWRVGSRHVPQDIVMSGGSDWFGLHRNFAHYIVTSEDELMIGLKYYYKYALLPAESFFHTVMMNSEFCTTLIDNNLHQTNWNRKQGCKCQYKHIVDWCGCSPNDFLPQDYNKLMASKNHPTFFGRKFEAIVSQEIINTVEGFVLNEPVKDAVATHGFWLNEYHNLDKQTSVDEAFVTYYHSFIRRGLRAFPKIAQNSQCTLTLREMIQVHVFSYKDITQGFIIQYTATSADQKSYVIETLVQPVEFYKPGNLQGPVSRLKYMHVGTSWDPKEEIFRNYGKFLGPTSDITMAIHWEQGEEGQEEFTVSAVYTDPALKVAASYDIKVKVMDRTSTHKPDFKKPLRPGNWTLQLLYKWQVVGETRFVIIPITHQNQTSTIPDSSVKLLHQGPAEGQYVDRDFKDFLSILKIKDYEVSLAKINADYNGKRVGQDLHKWVDSLTVSNYRLGESCINEKNAYCSNIPVCVLTRWSSLSPDPKSDLSITKQKFVNR